MKKRFLFFLTVIFAAVSLSACAKPTAESVLKKMTAASAAKEGMHADWDMDMDMGMVMPMFDINMTANMKLSGETESLNKEKLTRSDIKMSADMQFMKQDMDMKVFTKQEDDTHIAVYTGLEDEWIKTVTEVPEGSSDLSAVVNVADFGDRFTLAEEKSTVNDSSCFKLTGEIPVDEMMGKLNAVGISGTAVDSVDKEMFAGKSFRMVLYADEKTYLPVRTELFLTEGSGDAENGTEAAAAETAESEPAPADYEKEEEIDLPAEEDSQVTLDRMEMNMDFSYPDNIDIVIPEEALSAREVSEEDAEGLIADNEEEEALLDEPAGSQFDSAPGAKIIKEFGDGDALVLGNDLVDIFAENAYTDEDGIIYVDYKLVNKSDKNISVMSESMAANGVMSNDSIFETVNAGEEMTACQQLVDSQANGLTEPGTLKIRFSAMDEDTQEVLFSSDFCEITLGDAPDAEPRSGGREVFEDDNLKVIVYPETGDEYSRSIPLCIVNKSTEILMIEAEGTGIEGIELNGYLYSYIFPGCIEYGSIDIENTELADKQISSLSGLKTSLTVSGVESESDYFKELYTTEEIMLVE